MLGSDVARGATCSFRTCVSSVGTNATGGSVGQIIAVANQKGGVGKTTCTINLGGALASLGHRVLCVDLDPQANLTVGLGIDLNTLEKNIADVLIDSNVTLGSIIRPTKTKKVDVAPPTLD